ncbi:hypothetical protein [Sphingomonas sp. Ant H11]|uniref:hypothetical protein n=1 Tax=Sphingomonas sp. Ant H11 TaxID=1564113 RepID=UPI000AD61C98|nr:hypothetical protein [Sphingomonas sp. Ant H11]
MDDDLIDLVTSLSHLMEQESEALTRSGRLQGLAELVAAKLRLAGQIEAEVTKRERETPDWADALSEEQRAEMALVFGHLRDASIVNAQILERQIAFFERLDARDRSRSTARYGKTKFYLWRVRRHDADRLARADLDQRTPLAQFPSGVGLSTPQDRLTSRSSRVRSNTRFVSTM